MKSVIFIGFYLYSIFCQEKVRISGKRPKLTLNLCIFFHKPSYVSPSFSRDYISLKCVLIKHWVFHFYSEKEFFISLSSLIATRLCLSISNDQVHLLFIACLKITFYRRSNFSASKIQQRTNIEIVYCHDDIENLRLLKIHKLRVERWFQFLKIGACDWFLNRRRFPVPVFRVADLISGRLIGSSLPLSQQSNNKGFQRGEGY
mgnify:CR=1 FL=1